MEAKIPYETIKRLCLMVCLFKSDIPEDYFCIRCFGQNSCDKRQSVLSIYHILPIAAIVDKINSSDFYYTEKRAE